MTSKLKSSSKTLKLTDLKREIFLFSKGLPENQVNKKHK